MNKRNIMIFIAAKNFSEAEFLIVKNYLIKNRKKIFIASDAEGLAIGDKGLKIQSEVKLMNIHPANFASIIIIGGPGIVNYWDNEILQKKSKQFFEMGKVISAICAAPIILGKAGLLKNVDATCCPKFANEFIQTGANLIKEDVVSSGNIITGSGENASSQFIETVVNRINKL